MAQVRSIRAWAYLQLALNYGKVPFYTEPLLTEQDADDVSLDVKDRKDIEAICDYFINDLKPYSNTPWPALHTVGSVFMANCYFPVDMVLGDLYLWKASCQGTDAGRAYYREAAKCYFRWIMDTRNVGGRDAEAYLLFFQLVFVLLARVFFKHGNFLWVVLFNPRAESFYIWDGNFHHHSYGLGCQPGIL